MDYPLDTKIGSHGRISPPQAGGRDHRVVPYVNLSAQFDEERELIHECVEKVFSKGALVGLSAVQDFEVELREYCGVGNAVALSSGTDALVLALHALNIGPGDEVITPPNSHVASTGAIVRVGAHPVFADVLPDQTIDPLAVEAKITPRTKAIMPVHLTGRVAEMDRILSIARTHNLVVVEDAAQAFGAFYKGRRAGTIGTVGAFSAHPLKNLNAAGDAGFILTDDDDLAERVSRLRNHGLMDRDTVGEWGYVARMDVLQAEILRSRLRKIIDIVSRRRAHAALYREEITAREVFIPAEEPGVISAVHTMVIQAETRDGLKTYLSERGITAPIHYPVPLHLQPAAAVWGHKRGDFPQAERQADRILSLPVHQFLDREDICYVARTINDYYRT